jgi:hypothetical protein
MTAGRSEAIAIADAIDGWRMEARAINASVEEPRDGLDRADQHRDDRDQPNEGNEHADVAGGACAAPELPARRDDRRTFGRWRGRDLHRVVGPIGHHLAPTVTARVLPRHPPNDGSTPNVRGRRPTLAQ